MRPDLEQGSGDPYVRPDPISEQHKKAMMHSRAYSRAFLGALLYATLTAVASLIHQPQTCFARPGWAGMFSRSPTKDRGQVNCRKSCAIRLRLFGNGGDELGGVGNSRSSVDMNKDARLVQLQVEALFSSPMRRY